MLLSDVTMQIYHLHNAEGRGSVIQLDVEFHLALKNKHSIASPNSQD